MFLDDIPCKCIIHKDHRKDASIKLDNCNKKVRPYFECDSCSISYTCNNYTNHGSKCNRAFDTTYYCRDNQGIPIFNNYDYKWGLCEFEIGNNKLKFRINDYPSKNTIELLDNYDIYRGCSYAQGIGGGWFGSQKTFFQKRYDLDKVKLVNYTHHKPYYGCGYFTPYSPVEELSVNYEITSGIIFETKTKYTYKLILDWNRCIMYAVLYESGKEISKSNPESLRHL